MQLVTTKSARTVGSSAQIRRYSLSNLGLVNTGGATISTSRHGNGYPRSSRRQYQVRFFSGTPAGDTLDLAKIRNFGISAHIDSGKTTLTERILFYTGKIKEIHDVRGKSGVGAKMDSMALEREKGITIQSAATYCGWGENHFNVIDTPGHVDFTIEVERALRVLDGAVMVCCGVGAVQAQTLTVHRQMCRYEVPRIIFINKMDRYGSDPWYVQKQIKEKLGLVTAVIQVPIGEEDNFRGVCDVIRNRAVYFDGENGEIVRYEEIPADLQDRCKDVKDELTEVLADLDDEIAEKFLEGSEVPVELYHKVIRKGVIERTFSPIMMGSAYKNRGVQELLDGINLYLPSPLDRVNKGLAMADESEVVLKSDMNAPLVGYGFKIQDHPKAGVLTYMRIYQGKVRAGQNLLDTMTGKNFTPKRLVRMHSEEMRDIEMAGPGDIIALAGIEVTSGTTLTDGKAKVTCTSMFVPDPVMSLSIKLSDNAQAAKFSKAVARFRREDPTFRLETDPVTNQMVMSGMGELHLEIYVERMKREFGVNVVTGKPSVHYKETIQRKAPYDYQHKKQTGGRGQYGKVIGYFEPVPEEEQEEGGDNVKFLNLMKGQEIPPNYFSSIEKGFLETAKNGYLSGHPLVNIRFVLTDGKAHEVDSSDIAFRAAAKGAVDNFLKDTEPVIMEPWMKLQVVVPTETQAPVLQALSNREATVEGTRAVGTDATLIEAVVPLRTMFGYARELRGQTSGTGEFSMDFHEYVNVPGNIQERMVADYTGGQTEEEKLAAAAAKKAKLKEKYGG